MLQPEGLAWLDAACRSGGYIQHSVPYDQCVDMRFAAQVIEETPAAFDDDAGSRDPVTKEPVMSPADLHAFWRRTTGTLQQTPLRATRTDAATQSGREYVTSSCKWTALRGNACGPGTRSRRTPCRVAGCPQCWPSPAMAGDKPIPTHLAVSGFAVLTLYPRGQGESCQEWTLEHSTKLTYHVTEKERFYYRGAYMDCVRGLDFLASCPEVDAARLGMWSRSQGGGLTLATAALDQRLRVAVGGGAVFVQLPGGHHPDQPPV